MSLPTQASLWIFAMAATSAAVALPLWRKLCLRWDHVDAPGHRKIHGRPIPLAGGFAAGTGWIVGGVLMWALLRQGWGAPGSSSDDGSSVLGLQRPWMIPAGTLGVLFLGAWDDRRELGAGVKLLGQALIAGVVAAWGLRSPLPPGMESPGFFLTVLWILAVTNAFNLSDNMNGLCAGLGLIGASGVWVASSLRGGSPELGCLAALVAGGVAGYLPYNYPRASVFLGDAGSQSVGFLLAVLSLLTVTAAGVSERGPALAWARALGVVAVPCLDMAFVTVSRTLRGQPFWVGDTGHLSHRLSRTRLGKPGAVALLWAVGVLLGALSWR
ncbi:MAG: MraY family glycosyltransferase [Verrucomicrobiota bacterium]